MGNTLVNPTGSATAETGLQKLAGNREGSEFAPSLRASAPGQAAGATPEGGKFLLPAPYLLVLIGERICNPCFQMSGSPP